MIQIGKAPKIRGVAIPALIVLAAVFGTLTAGALGWSGTARVLAVVAWVPVLAGATQLYLQRRYQPLQVDFAAGTAVVGGEEVPLGQVVAATRLFSVGIGAAYLEYRFQTAGGATARVLVQGHPLRGLDAEGRAELHRFIERSGIRGPSPAEGRTASQEVLLQTLSTPAWKAVPVDAELLLSELDQFDAPPPDPTPPAPPAEGAGAPGATPDAELERRWLADEADAEEWLRANPVPGRRLRRMFAWLIALLVVAFAAVVAIGAFQESRSSSGQLDDDLQNVLSGLMVVLVLAAVVAYLAYTVARMRHQRAQLAAARSWAAIRGPEQVQRGLPPVLVVPFFQRPPGHHFRAALAWTAVGLGALLALSGPVAMSTGDLGAGTGLALLGAGVALIAAAVALFVTSRRRIRAQLAEAVHLAGARLSFQASGGPEPDPVSPPSDGPVR